MTDATELEHLAEADGAQLLRALTGAWWAKDRDGITVVRGAMSRAEAALLYCEDKHLVGTTPAGILEYIKAQYRPYDSMPEFREGFEAWNNKGARREDPYEGVKSQAFCRGANAAMLYGRAMAHLEAHKEDVEKAGPGWLAQLIKTGRC
jgi:hypothetical protein